MTFTETEIAKIMDVMYSDWHRVLMALGHYEKFLNEDGVRERYEEKKEESALIRGIIRKLEGEDNNE